MDKQIAAKGRLKTYLMIPLALTAVWAALIVVLYFVDRNACLLTGFFMAIYLCLTLFLYYYRQNRLLDELIAFATQYGQVQKELLNDFILPYALLDEDGVLLWANKEFNDIIEDQKKKHRPIWNYLPELLKEDLPGRIQETEKEMRIGNRDYRAAMKKVFMQDFLENNSVVETDPDTFLIALYLFDETEINEATREKEANRHVCGVLSLDNMEECLDSVEDVRQSLLLALVEKKITNFFTNVGGMVRKVDKDRFIFVINKVAFEEMKATRFTIVDFVKTVNIGNSMSFTISMGLSINNGTYNDDMEAARVAHELALGRGGDQVVVRDGESTTYYGGKSLSVEKSNRVKARVKAHALRTIMENHEKILVMGHSIPDIDALGAAIGLVCAGRSIKKQVKVVVNDPQPVIRQVMQEYTENLANGTNIFVNSKEALEMADATTCVIVVDTNRPSYTECPELLDKAETIVVIDHHRQNREIIEGADLNYVEPYASSACEMVAEILQYFDEAIKLKPIESNALYSGIIIDTDNFKTRTGVRTFEAAAFLRRNGADLNKVRKVFRETMDDYRLQAKIIAGAEIFENAYVISECPTDGSTSPTVVSSQAANQLLNVVGVKASFVLSLYHDQIYISARAIDEVNVQLIMERLGGGGHLNVAGAQLKDMTIEEAKALLKETIKEMKEEGEIA